MVQGKRYRAALLAALTATGAGVAVVLPSLASTSTAAAAGCQTGSAASGWTCWRDGGTCPGIGYQVAGFQSLVNDVSQWLTYKPTDPQNNLAAFAHVYNFNPCSNTSCYDSQMGPVAAQVPFALTEIGENDCAHGFIDTLMSWTDTRGVGYLGWTWNTWPCNSGQGLKDRLALVSN